MAGVPINDGNDVRSPRYLDLRQGKIVAGKSVPYDEATEALAAIPDSRKAEGLPFWVKNGDGVETWRLAKDEFGAWIVKKDEGGGGSGGAEIFIDVTKAQADTLIANKELVKGALYRVSGVHKRLYDTSYDQQLTGNSIILLALSIDAFAEDGWGEFWNPKYEIYKQWENKGSFTPSGITGTFNETEKITNNLGGKATLWGNVLDGVIRDITGTWVGAASITGDVTGATANIADITTPSFAIGDKVIWGNFVWANKTGVVGKYGSARLLQNTTWELLPYDATNYNFVIDRIRYDYHNDWITSRYDSLGNEYELSPSYVAADTATFPNDFILKNSVSYFPFGNPDYRNNKIRNANVDMINYRLQFVGNIIEEGTRVSLGYADSTANFYSKDLSKNNTEMNFNVFKRAFVRNFKISSAGGVFRLNGASVKPSVQAMLIGGAVTQPEIFTGMPMLRPSMDGAILWVGVSDNLMVTVSPPSEELEVKSYFGTRIPFKCKINKAAAFVSVAPTGSSVAVEIVRNGVKVGSSNDKLIIVAGAIKSVNVHDIVGTILNEGDLIEVNVTQVGSATPGETLQIYFELTKS